MNQLTHWLDSSQVYGSSLEEQRGLRAGRAGRLTDQVGLLGLLDFWPAVPEAGWLYLGASPGCRCTATPSTLQGGPEGALLPTDQGEDSCTGACFRSPRTPRPGQHPTPAGNRLAFTNLDITKPLLKSTMLLKLC